MKKLLSLMALVMALLTVMLVATSAANNTPFTDVPDNSWYTESVNYCYAEKLMNGSSSTTFAPNMTVDRSQVAQVLANMSEYNSSDYAGKTSFPDVKTTDWFAPAIEWAKQNNVTSGTDKGTFEPKKAVTREQLAQFMYNYAAFAGVDNSTVDTAVIDSFKDVTTVSSWAKKAMAWNVAEGILTGSNNNLMPKKTATRAELAAIIERFDKLTSENTKELATGVTVSGAFTDDMMLQRDEKCSVWGWAPDSENGKSVVVEINGKKAEAVVENGEWKAVFAETFPYSTEPTVITVKSAGDDIVFNNVLFGDVYYVIGQSNVYYSIRNLAEDLERKKLTHEYQIEFDHTKNLRFFRNSNQYHRFNVGDRAPGTTTLYNDAEVWSGWQTVAEVETAFHKNYINEMLAGNPADTYIFSALGYITAYEMSNETDVPIGVIEIDASGFPLIAFAPNELADKWGTEIVDEKTGIHYWAITDVTTEETGYLPLITSNALTSRMAYNQQLYPLINFSTAGIWWYQGESDWTTTEEYRGVGTSTFADQFTELMQYYRSVMGNDDFPVYMIEFPSCFKGTSPNQAYISTGSVRTEQGKIPTMLDDFYLVSSGDFFNDFYWENNIHPYIKHKQAMRLSKMVLATGNYDSKYDIDYVAGPIFVSENFTDNTFTTVDLKFDHVGDGLVNHDEEGIGIWGLEVLVNGEWIEASGAQITANDTVTVTADARIDGVRYHRATDSTFPTWATLSNSENIPCAAFVKYFHKFENL
ncbi:MAG: S-layer homology domain-containing protein [Ruminococcaceae bacterium]|nr:S-layer homology domain-containing protein [Oscillospiraceae bacterium]